MKTRISSFCDDYKNLLTAIDGSIDKAVERIQAESREEMFEDTRTRLSNARHRFNSLREKIEHQQAYLIIFGPLKSGKSTLMNAISGEYVSEVTAMPAYPCLVYVSHGDETSFSAIKYNGTSEEFNDADGLNQVLNDSHATLASRIRMHEGEGEEFDPSVHYTEAVRRIDVKTPVPALREANTVLVDSPGLYSRMKFGYDLMTREFRDSAACAVFVVRSDNLFLDQVFDEFTELLDEFSRIFLVVNIDSSKRDLQPDGTLGPSIESSDPEKIIEAFRSLAMTAPLREADEQGRLNIYAVDLLNAAAASLSDGPFTVEAPSFDDFLGDLTDYLNSSDYQQEFERDSLKQGSTICSEVRDACDLDKCDAFQRDQAELKRAAEEIPPLIRATEGLSGSDMASAFDRSRQGCINAAETLAATAREESKGKMRKALDEWVETDDSLQALMDHWNATLKTACEPIVDRLPRMLLDKFDTPSGGADLSNAQASQLRQVELDLGEFVRPAVTKLKQADPPSCDPMKLDLEQIPVSRSFFDRILFRNGSKVREKLFGEPDSPERNLSSAKKRKRLGEEGFVALREEIDAFLDRTFPEPQTAYVTEHANAFIAQFRSGFEKQLEVVKAKLAKDLEATTKRLEADDRILLAAADLDREIAVIEGGIEKLESGDIPEPELELEVKEVEIKEPKPEPSDEDPTDKEVAHTDGESISSGA